MDLSNTPVPLWRQLQATSAVLVAIRGGESATPALARVEAELRPGVQALVFQVLRWLGMAEALRRHLAKRTPSPQVDALMCTALALLWRNDEQTYEPFTVVNQAVEAAKRNPTTRMQSSFVNACLRRFLRERDDLVAETEGEPVATWNHPRWWIERLRRDWPRDWESILAANNTQPPLVLRVNVRRASVADYLKQLDDAGIDASPVGAHGVVLDRPVPVQQIPGFTDGVVSVQDAAAQLAAPLLLHDLAEPESGKLHILDACAAPGGKTAHLLELVDADVTALEIDPQRTQRIQQTLDRLQLRARVVTGDASRPAGWWDGHLFDAILLDAPCTASGIVRRHPDVRWLRRESDVEQLTVVQANLLAAMWPLLKPGGRMVYCTCSVFRSEGESQIQTFVAHNKDASIRPAPGHLKPHTGAKDDAVRDNQSGDHDGFFYAVLQKQAP
ncbi:16S rRNA (cytosine(967)-C(5))-methyltransferase RsmB [Variovorax sp. VNK109]|uniref:16S rRNA (cytosine(967)-C(5))-methyltransferase RsmB n=1 Tax=Variovorax sp. VNK109 TaxID=3400919 RepID=UPI003BFF15DF